MYTQLLTINLKKMVLLELNILSHLKEQQTILLEWHTFSNILMH